MKNKLCIVVTGLPSTGKTYFANRLVNELSKNYLAIGYTDLPTWCISKEEETKKTIKDIFDKTGVVIQIIETHPPYLYNLDNDDYETLYIHFKLPHAAWTSNKPTNKKADFAFGNGLTFDDFVHKCDMNDNYYRGANDMYEVICTRGGLKNRFTADCEDSAIARVINFAKKNIEPNADKKKKEFDEYSKKKLSHLSPDYEVFQYQTFDYGGGIINIGMSDPYFKWHNVLKMSKFNLMKKTVLDIGCNIGEVCNLAANKGAIATGIEYDKPFYEAAVYLQNNFRTRPIEFINEDFLTYDFKGQFDVVMALAVLYMFYDKATPDKVFERIRSITKEVFIGELTYNETNKSEIIEALNKHFKKVEFIGNSMRTDIKIRKRWNERDDYTETRQVWHCYV